jgi:hypothetical protein
MKKHIFGILLATVFTGSLQCMYYFNGLTPAEEAAFQQELPFFLDHLAQEEARLSQNLAAGQVGQNPLQTQENLANAQDMQQLAREQMKKPSERRTRPWGIRKTRRTQGGNGPRTPGSF